MKISLWGYYGFNYGDDIMMQLFINEFEKKNIKVYLIDSHNGNLKNKVKNKNVIVIEYWKLSKIDKLKTLRMLARSTKLNIWGGGTVFTDVDNDGNFLNFIFLKLFGGKIGYISVGVGNIKRISRKIKTNILIKLSNLISLRDTHSYNYCLKIKPKVTNYSEDVTYHYFQNMLSHFNKKKEGNYLLISFRNLQKYYGKSKEKYFANQLISLIPNIMKQNSLSKIIFLPLDRQDIEINRYILNSLDKKIESEIIITSDVDEMTDYIKSTEFYISGRLHGSVASEFFNVKTVTLSYSNKIDYFYKSISRKYIDLNNEDITNEKILEIIAAFNNVQNFSSKGNAFENINLIYKFLEQ